MKMKLRQSELIVSEYCLGTMTFGEQTNERFIFVDGEVARRRINSLIQLSFIRLLH